MEGRGGGEREKMSTIAEGEREEEGEGEHGWARDQVRVKQVSPKGEGRRQVNSVSHAEDS